MFRLARFHTRRAHGSYNAVRLSHIAQAMTKPTLHNTNSLGTSELCSIISNEQDISRIFDIFTNAKVNGPSPSRRLLRALIAACKNHPERMHDLFLDMEKYNITPTAIIYSKFIQAAVATQNKSFLTNLCKSQSRSHIKQQQSELSIQLVQACVQLGQLEMIHQAAFPTNTTKPSMSLLIAVMEAAKTKPLEGIQVWEVLRENDIVPDYSFVHQFLHLLVRIGYLEERTNQVVDITLDILKYNNEHPELQLLDTKNFGLIIRTLVIYRRLSSAVSVVQGMYQIGVTPFEGDIIGLIDNLIKFGALECGRKLQIVMTKNAPLSYPIYNRFLRLYFACASFKDVSEFKGAIPLQLRYNEASSSIYLESNMRSAHGESVKKALDHMISKKRVISAKQMNYALKALSYSGKREEMFELFDTMKEKYNVEPTSMHHTSVVEAFANSQDFEKAEELATAFRLNEWESLMVMLNACKISANVERAEKYYQKLLSIDPLHAKPHLLMLDVKNCSSLDMYKIMDEKGIELPKLTARTTVNGIGFEFTDGSITSEQQKDAVSYWNDYLHPYCHEIGLLQVSSLLVPNVAVAHALSAKDDTEESVVVTLDGTMCLHDHQIIASISSVTGTEIIINETNRIHKFKNGQCICKNCW